MRKKAFISFTLASTLYLIATISSAAQPYIPLEEEKKEPTAPSKYKLVEYFTADTLDPGEIKLGLDFEYAPIAGLMVGTDLLAVAVGAPTIQFKKALWQEKQHRIAAGLVAAYFDKSTALWGLYKDHFVKLNATILRPSLSWTNSLSKRLNIHSYWSVGFGKTKAQLSEKGKRALWESKNPDGNWETKDSDDGDDDDDNSTSKNQEEKAYRNSLSSKTLQLQTLTGMLSDIFQITGEYKREGNKKVLITTRIEQSILEKLTSNGIRLTAAQQWIFSQFQFRIGIGIQYQVLNGEDLDGEKVNDTGIYPATDIDFYWRF